MDKGTDRQTDNLWWQYPALHCTIQSWKIKKSTLVHLFKKRGSDKRTE